MATYTSTNGVKLISTGDEAGTWGDSTNVNLQILDRAANGFASIALTGTSYTLPVAAQPSAAQDGHYKAIKFTGSPGGTCTVTLEQNTRARMYMLVNSTNQTVVVTQGSGSNVTIAAGDSAIVLADGAGSGAAVEEFDTTATKFARRLELISETVLSSDTADVTFTLPTGYRDFQLVLNNVKSSGQTTTLFVEVSTDGGSNFITSSYVGFLVYQSVSGSTLSTNHISNTSGVTISNSNISGSNTSGTNGVINVFNPLDASQYTSFTVDTMNQTSATTVNLNKGSYVYTANAAVNAINLSHKTGASVAAGAIVALYGMKDF